SFFVGTTTLTRGLDLRVTRVPSIGVPPSLFERAVRLVRRTECPGCKRSIRAIGRQDVDSSATSPQARSTRPSAASRATAPRSDGERRSAVGKLSPSRMRARRGARVREGQARPGNGERNIMHDNDVMDAAEHFELTLGPPGEE